jgi:DNA replicative helicase MCM subunit Mcm2 (Cdc46/Mcm family)
MEDKVPINVSDIRSKHLHKEVVVKGFVFEMNMVQPKIQKAAFKCQQCGAIIYEDVLEEPEICSGCQENTLFKFIEEKCKFTDHREVILVEIPSRYDNPSTRYSLKIELEDDNVDIVKVGDVIQVTGMLRTSTTHKKNRKAPEFILPADAIHKIGQYEHYLKRVVYEDLLESKNDKTISQRDRIKIIKDSIKELSDLSPEGKAKVEDVYERVSAFGVKKKMQKTL